MSSNLVQAASADHKDTYLDRVFAKAAKSANVPVGLLRAICWVESEHNPRDFAFGDAGGHNSAVGLCQVLVNTASDFIHVDESCAYGATDCNLFDPYLNALVAAKYLRRQLDRYNGSTTAAIAAYNAGSVLTCSEKGILRSHRGKLLARCTPGSLLNEFYLNRVLKALEEGR